MKKGNGFIFLNVKNIISITALSLLLSSSFCFAKEKNLSNSGTDEQIAELMKNAEYKEEFIKKLIKEITDNYSLSDIDEDEKSEFEELLKAELFTFNKKNIKDLLEDYGFNKEFMKKIVDKIPEIYAGTPEVSVQELVDLSNMKSEDIEKAIKKYLETGTIEKKYKFIITEELISIIREKEAITREKEAITREKEAIINRGIKAEQGIKRIKELDRKFKLIIKGIEKSLNNAGIH